MAEAKGIPVRAAAKRREDTGAAAAGCSTNHGRRVQSTNHRPAPASAWAMSRVARVSAAPRAPKTAACASGQ